MGRVESRNPRILSHENKIEIGQLWLKSSALQEFDLACCEWVATPNSSDIPGIPGPFCTGPLGWNGKWGCSVKRRRSGGRVRSGDRVPGPATWPGVLALGVARDVRGKTRWWEEIRCVTTWRNNRHSKLASLTPSPYFLWFLCRVHWKRKYYQLLPTAFQRRPIKCIHTEKLTTTLIYLKQLSLFQFFISYITYTVAY